MVDFARLVLAADTSQMKTAAGDIDRVAQSGAKAEGATSKLAGGFKRMVGPLVAAAAAMASVGAALRVIGDFERDMSKLSAVTRASAGELAAMRDIARDLGSTTEFTAAQAAQGLTFLGMAGFSAAESMKAIPAVLDLATASAMGLGQAADVASNIMSGFGVAAEDAAQVADLLAAASSRANTDVAQLGEAMKFVGPVASALGISMADTAAAIGALSDAGIQGGMAGTSLRNVLSNLANTTPQATKALKDMGVSLEQVNPQTNSLVDIVQTLADAGLDAATALTVFGDRGGPAILALTSQVDGLKNLSGELSSVEGEAKRMAETMRDNLAGDMDGLKSAAEGLIIALGDAGLGDVLRAAVQVLTELVRGISGAIGYVASFGSAISGVVGALLGFGESERQAAAAVEQANAQIGGQLEAMRKLSVVSADGGLASLVAATNALTEARARLRNIEAIQDETNALVNLSLARLELDRVSKIEAMTAIRAGTDAYEEQERALVAIMNAQEELRKLVTDTSAEQAEAVQIIETLQAGIDAARRSMEGLGAVEIAPRIAAAADEADRLANNIIDALNAQNRLNAGYKSGAVLGGRGNVVQTRIDGIIASLGGEYVPVVRRAEAATRSLSSAVSGAGKAIGEADREASALAKTIEKLEFDANPLAKYSAGIAELDALLDSGLSMDAYQRAVQDLNDELANSTPMVNDVANAFADLAMRGFKDFQSFTRAIVDSFKRMIFEMIATAARNRIMLSIGMGGGLAGTAANAAPGILGSMGGGAGLAGMAGGSGLMGGLGNALGGGLGNVFSVGANAAAAGGGALATIGAAIPVIGAVALAFAAFRKTTKTLDSGLRVTVKNMDALVETFKKVETSRFFGLSKSKSTSFSDASDDVADPIVDAIRAIQGSVSGMADSLGIGADAFDDFSFQFNVSLRKLNDEQKQAAIQAGFQKFTDAMAQTALSAGGLDVEMEGAAARMDALASSLGVVNQTMRFLARDLFDVSIAGAQAAEQLIGFFGGFDNFNATQQSYFENFYSEQEQVSLRFAELTRNFETLGLEAEGLAIALPETNAAFRALVEAQDLTTEAGRGAYAALLLLSGEFASLQDATGSLKGAMSGLSDAMAAEVRGLQRQLLQLQGNIAAVRSMTLADLQSDEARAIQREIFALEDEKAKSSEKVARATRSATSASNGLTDAMKKAEEVSKEREKLERAILGLEGNVIELRRRELTEVDASNRALQSRIWLLEDEAKVTSEREGLERRLLELQGNVAELRRRELDGLDATNQGLQLAIWKLEDFNAALRGLNQNDFATLVDFNRAAALEANRLQSTMAGMGSVEGVIFESGEAFTAASSGLTAALGSMVTAAENLTDQLADFAVSIRAMVRAPANDDMIMKGRRFLQRPQAFQPVQSGDIRGEVIELKEYVRELVKINHKQERTLKEIQLQGETA
jgi:TP901 family phage tail tape measure protein